MDALQPQLQAFLAQARKWEDRVKRTTFSDCVSFTVDPSTSEFTVCAEWLARSGKRGKYCKTFTRELVFGPSVRMGRPAVQKRVCVHMQEFMKEVLQSRGV
jgi:3-oxoacyl-[acyl-carrier-protein] synthase III